MKNKEKIIIPGGSGFLGKILSKYFHSKNIPVVILSRRKFHSPYAEVLEWDGENIGEWAKEFEGAKAIINLAGLSVNCRYTEKVKPDLINSRVLSTRVIGQAIKDSKDKPEAWLNSSTATIYEHTYGPPHTESNGKICANVEAKDEFSIQIALDWESEFNKAECGDVRKILLRSAIVLGDEKGTAYTILRRLAKFGLGGKMGHGKQYFSWIHEDDFCRAVEFLIDNQSPTGAYNIAAPNALTNSEAMRALRKAYHIPFGLPASKLMLEVGAFFLRTETELIIKSRRVFPEKLLSENFKFKYENFPEAISALENKA